MNEVTTTQNEQVQVTEQLLCEYLKTLTNGLHDNERTQFLAVAKAFNLNPFKREIYAVAYGQGEKRTFSIIVGYETYLKRAEEFPQYDGYDIEFGASNGEMFAKCHVYRKDRSHSTTSTVWLSEYSTGRSLWLSKPRAMLEKVAICTAFRRAFPSEYGGMPYAPEELSQSTEAALKAQGMTEVKADAQPQQTARQADEPTASQKFAKELNDMKAENPAAFEMVRKSMHDKGWFKPSDVPVEEYDGIRKVYMIAKLPERKEDAAEAETVKNTESEEVENG